MIAPKEAPMSFTNLIARTRTAFRLLLATAIIAVAGTGTMLAQNDSPTSRVETVVNNLLVILRDPDFNFETARPAIRNEIQSAFDDVAMAQSVLSTNWRTATPAQQEEFKNLLLQTIESTYIGRIRSYSNESVVFRNESITNDRATVNAVVLAAGGEIPIAYRLRKRSDGWFVFDVEIENVSMVSTYRETYRNVVRRSGMDGLLEQMREKLTELQARENI